MTFEPFRKSAKVHKKRDFYAYASSFASRENVKLVKRFILMKVLAS